MKVKICGIKSNDDVEIINQHKPDYAGFIFYPKSKRYLTKQKARSLKDKIDPNIKVVGVFVNDDLNYIEELVNDEIIDIIQLHGEEDQKAIERLKNLDVPIIKAIRVKDNKSLDLINDLEPDYFLFDIYTQEYGGSGKQFNWEILEDYKKDIPYFLAGGLNIDNLEKALKLPAFSLDISSGVETNGNKDKEKVEDVINTIRGKNGR